MAELTDLLSWLGGLRNSVAADVVGVAVPEMVRDIVQGMEGFDWLSEPLRDAVAGFGAVNERFGVDITETLGQLGRSLRDLVALGRDSDLLGSTLASLGKYLTKE
jgi:hypothetical protein